MANKISPNFYWHELWRSQEATRMGIDNRPDDEAADAIERVVVDVLQPMRDEIGESIMVEAGYLDPRVCAAGGSPDSPHADGTAVDIDCMGLSHEELAQVAVNMGLPFHRLVIEYPDLTREDPNQGSLHVEIEGDETDSDPGLFVKFIDPDTGDEEIIEGLEVPYTTPPPPEAPGIDDRISENFSVRELCRSRAAARLGLPNLPSGEHFENMRHLVLDYAQPLRSDVGEVLTVSSCYRSPRVNKRIGGAKRSAHIQGLAMDHEFHSIPNIELAEYVASSPLWEMVDTLIAEFLHPNDGTVGWIHTALSAAGDRPRQRKLCAYKDRRGKTRYTTGFYPP